jgi:hypothetical protein
LKTSGTTGHLPSPFANSAVYGVLPVFCSNFRSNLRLRTERFGNVFFLEIHIELYASERWNDLMLSSRRPG